MFNLHSAPCLPYWRQDHIKLREEIQNFIQTEARPLWHISEENPNFPWKAREAAARAGLAGLDISCDYGGRELDAVSQGIAYEECGHLDVDARELVGSGHGRIIDRHGSAALKSKWLPNILSGKALIGIGVTEDGAGSDIRAMTTRATPSDGGYIISGTKAHVSRIHEAAGFIVFAKTDPTSQSLSAFLVNTNQVGISRHEIKPMGLRGWSYGNITFSDVEVPEDNLLGSHGEGFEIFERHFSYWRTLITLLCIGTATQSVTEGISYANKRTAFGGLISRLSPVLFSLSEAASKLYAARLLCYQSLWLEDQGHRNVAEAAMCKWYGTTVAFDAVNAVIQVAGARGYETSYPHEKRLRDIRGLMIADGSNEVMKALIGRELFGKKLYNEVVRKIF